MSDDASDPTKRPDRTFRAPLGRRGRVKIYLDEDAGAADRAKGVKGGRGPTSPAGMLHADRSEDEYVIPSARPFVHFHDLATELLPSGTAEYRERNPWLELGRDYDPAEGIRYSDADYKAWEDEMLGSLLTGDEENDSNPLGTWPIESSPTSRKAPNTWPWNMPGMGQSVPNLLLRLRAGQTAPPGGPAISISHWKQVSPAGESWSARNTAHDLAPRYGYWKVPGHGRYGSLRMLDFGGYVAFNLETLAGVKVTAEPTFGAEEVVFKMAWPIKVYSVPRLFGVDEVFSVSFLDAFTYGTTGAMYEKSEVVERGTMNTSLGVKEWRKIRTTAESCVLDPFAGHGWGEYALYPLSRLFLFPDPAQVYSGVGAIPPEEALARFPAGLLKLTRRWIFNLLYRKVVQQRTDLDGFGTIVLSRIIENVTRRRAVTNLGPPPYQGLGDIFTGRRVMSDWGEVWPVVEGLLKSEMSAEMGVDVDTIPGSVHSADYNYSGQIRFLPNYHYSPPTYNGAGFLSFSTPRNERNGQLRAVVVAGTKRYFVWRRV